jgi:hypothetical protein
VKRLVVALKEGLFRGDVEAQTVALFLGVHCVLQSHANRLIDPVDPATAPSLPVVLPVVREFMPLFFRRSHQRREVQLEGCTSTGHNIVLLPPSLNCSLIQPTTPWGESAPQLFVDRAD